MKEIRIGLVGSGWMGKAHSSALADAEMLFGPDYGTASFEIVADANEEAAKSAQKKIGFKRTSTDWLPWRTARTYTARSRCPSPLRSPGSWLSWLPRRA